ncbi:hypothetical protein [Rufibacter sp. XAAS-G3-1]|uniref:hypothetical protein n=1 Tax=Rufibacter sp. XAAS-G3-1 TaxID=2729134 RepID=UPI0015E68F7D|nr:hypothetical protein [Rufibacter sp. XAAS-G3-1]
MAKSSLKSLSAEHRQNVVSEVLDLLRTKYGQQIGHIEITQSELDALGHIPQASQQEIDAVNL